MLLNCGVGEDSWESLGLQEDPTSPSILKEISPEYSLEGLMLKLKLQYFGHLMQRTDSLEKTLMLGNIEGRRIKGWQRMVGWHHWLNGHEFEQALGDDEGQACLACCSPWGRKESDTTEQLNNNSKNIHLVLIWVCVCLDRICLKCDIDSCFLAIPHGMWNFPDRGLNPHVFQGKLWVLTTGPTGKSYRFFILATGSTLNTGIENFTVFHKNSPWHFITFSK